MRRVVLVSALAAALAFAASAAAAVSPVYQVAGIEIGVPQGNVSPFAGIARGSTGDRGFWQANVAHDPLAGCSTVGSSCAITGGTFTLTSSAGAPTAAAITGGSVTLVAQAPGCGTQTYSINASLSTPGTFTGVLTHYRLLLRGVCTTVFATVQGTVVFGSASF